MNAGTISQLLAQFLLYIEFPRKLFLMKILDDSIKPYDSSLIWLKVQR